MPIVRQGGIKLLARQGGQSPARRRMLTVVYAPTGAAGRGLPALPLRGI